MIFGIIRSIEHENDWLPSFAARLDREVLCVFLHNNYYTTIPLSVFPVIC